VRILPNIGAFQAELNRLQGRFGEASAWATGVEPLPLTWSIAVVDPRLVQARIFLTQNLPTRREHATQLLAELRAHCGHIPNRRLCMEIDALEALLLAQAGQGELALETLARVLGTAETDGWIRMFIDLGQGMQDLLIQIAARDIAPHYVARILHAFPADPGPAGSVQIQPGIQTSLTEPISERELEVLTLLAQRYSNKEIARRLYIAPATVKSHTINIYRKLNAGDRREAVALANDLGLVTMHA
jgi:LuxR family maltose regulon positive regulatory protein